MDAWAMGELLIAILPSMFALGLKRELETTCPALADIAAIPGGRSSYVAL